MQQTKEIAARIAELRDVCGWTKAEFAALIGVEPTVYDGYERDGTDIPISVLFRIANLCGVDMTEILTGTAAKLDTYHIVRAGEGRPVDRYPGYSFEDLAFRYSHKVMQPLLVTLDPSDEPAALVSHSGQEFNYVVSGKMILTFGDKEFELNAGDSVYFNPTHRHGQKCGGSEPAVFLTVIAE